MQGHICPRRTGEVDAAKAAISVQASCVASWVGTGTVWKWSYTQIDSQGPASARLANADMVDQCSAGSIPKRSIRHPCGMNVPNRISCSAAVMQRTLLMANLGSALGGRHPPGRV